MTDFHRIPTFWSYLAFMLLLTGIAGAAPFLMCMNFADGFFNTHLRNAGACALSFTTRLGQSGALVMYVSALLAVVPPLIYTDKVAVNRKAAKRLIPKLEGQLKSEKAAQKSGDAIETAARLANARRHLRDAERYPKVQRLIVWFGLTLIFVGTVMQVIETGG